MRLHRLEFTAIGPFAGTQVIDFTCFDASGLFLLEGPTGAGKSTIIDAIAFALYGDVARLKDASKDRMRSDYADAKVNSEVDLVFEVSSGIYRVHRSPSYIPAGHKSPRNQPSVLVRVVEDPSAPTGYRDVAAIERGARQTDPEIVRLVGLSKEQFLQTIVLPQGKFSQFLTATSQEREAILRDIFGTRMFQDFQNRLVQAANVSRQSINAAESAALTAFEALVRASRTDQPDPAVADGAEDHAQAGPDVDEVDPVAADAQPSSDAADRFVEASRAALSNAERALTDYAGREEDAARALDAARTSNSAIDERLAILAELAAAEERLPEIAEQTRRRDTARTIAALWPLVEAADEADEVSQAARRRLRHLLDDPAHPDDAIGDADLETTQGLTSACRGSADQRDALIAQRARLADLLAVETTLPQRQADLAALGERIDRLAADREKLDVKIEQVPEILEQGRADLARMNADLEALPAQRAARDALDVRYQAAKKLTGLIAELKARSDEVGAAKRAAQEAGANALVARERWLADAGSALAETLEDGAACPVCGSLDHPSPAGSTDGRTMTLEEVRRLEDARSKADEHLQNARVAHAEATQAVIAAKNVAQGDEAGLSLELAEAQAIVDALQSVVPRRDQLRADLDTITAELEADKAERARLIADSASAKTRHDSTSKALESDQARCAEATEGASSLSDLDKALGTRIAALDGFIDALEDRISALAALEAARARRSRALVEAEFSDDAAGLADVRAGHLPSTRIDELSRSIEDFEHRRRSLSERLASPALAAAESAEIVETAPLEASLTRARKQRESAQREVGALHERARSIKDLAERFRAARAALDDARSAAGAVCRLAGIADATSKENLAQTPLASWVLVSRLDEVLAAANPRLQSISNGRYELVSTPDDGTSSRKSGLGLKIIDHETDRRRSTQTLSGGETFYTSLALALGLADVVTSEAGGVELRTIFIDEGFGSLDAATLELVMAQLHDLRQSGRNVGVISHIEEMARQISDQIRVRRSGLGSTLSVSASSSEPE